MNEVQLENAANCARVFCSKYNGPRYKNNMYRVLDALATLTLRDLNEGKDASDCQYTVFDINEEMTGRTDELREEATKKRLNKHLRALDDVLPSHIVNLNEYAAEEQLTHIPSYSFSAGRGGGSGHISTHSIKPVEIEQYDISDANSVLQGNAIKYHLEKIDKLPFWARWLDNFELSGWRLKLIALFVITIMSGMTVLLLVFLGWLSQINSSGLVIQSFVAFGAAELWLFWLIYPLFASGNKRIIPAPMLLLPASIVNGQLESVATDQIRESTGRNIRIYRLVSYSGSCPICNCRVELESGGKEFYNRLIGRCLEAPDEHVFSFDRMKKIGYPLRDYYE